MGQIGCFLDEDKEGQGSLFLDCTFLLLLKAFKQWLKIQNVPDLREEGRLKRRIHLFVLDYDVSM